MQIDDVKRLTALEAENAKLKKLLAERMRTLIIVRWKVSPAGAGTVLVRTTN